MFATSLRHATREDDASVRCGTTTTAGNGVAATCGSATTWNQWAAVAQTAALEHRTASADRLSLARAAADARRELLAATEAAEHAVARAHALSQQLERAVEILARSEAPGHTLQPVKPVELWERLSLREREVLTLIAEGRSNKSIAEALFVSPNTVKTHVAALLTKLEVDSRVQLAALAVRHSHWPDAA